MISLHVKFELMQVKSFDFFFDNFLFYLCLSTSHLAVCMALWMVLAE